MDADLLTKLLALAQAAGSAAAMVPMTTRGARQPDEDTRHRILEAIRTTPGVHGRLLRDMLDLGGSELDRHIHHLEEAGLIEAVEINNRLRFYPAGQVPADDLLVLEIPTERRVAQIVLKTPGVTSGDVANYLGVTRRRAQMALTDLRDAGLVKDERKGFTIHYAPTARLRAALGDKA